jgi:predicted phosphodiesterase
MKICSAAGCNVEFEPQTANHKYADKNCRKSIDSNGLCKYRRDNGLFEIEPNPITGEIPVSDSELRLSYNKLLQEFNKLKTKSDDLAGAVYRAVKEDIEASKYVPVPKPKIEKSTKNEEVAVAILADWQLAKITPDYNSAVCEERIAKFAQKVIDLTNLQRKDHPVKELRVWALGDIIEGELIFPGQSFLVDGGLYRQITVDGPRIMKNFINKMLENFEKVTFVGVIGNHGSIGGRARRDHDPETNGDRMLYRITQLMFEKEKRVEFKIPDGRGERHWYAVDKIGNYKALLCHGDQFGSLSTFYSFQKKAYGWKIGAVEEDFDDIYIGHFHTPTKMTFNTVQLRISGSPESTNTYAAESLAAVGRPSQSLVFVHPEKGIVTAEYNCWLD